jgi:VWFA-related protein
MTRPALAFVFTAALLLAAPGASPAQEPSPEIPSPQVFVDAVDVRVVNLEVVVTDRQGNRVTGLQPEDFRLLVDRQEVAIEFFTEITAGRAREPEEAPTVAGIPALAPGQALERSYLLFIDEYFSIKQDRDYVVRSLMDDLTFLQPGDRMAIVAFDGSDLTMLSTWSTSRDQLRRALRQALDRPTYGLVRLAEQRRIASSRMEAGFPGVPSARGEELRIQASQLERQIRTTTSAAAATLRSFADPPGRKIMMLLSGGWPYDPSAYLAGRPPSIDDARPDIDRLYGSLAATANRLGYTIYAIDVPDSTRAFATVDAATASIEEREGQFPESPAVGDPAEGGVSGGTRSIQRQVEVSYTLEYLSRNTGGEALVGPQRRGSLASVVEDSDTYYWIGFTPSWQEDDRRRDIRVEVTRPGLRVRSRSSFLDLSRASSAGMMLESALLFGSPPQPHQLMVILGEPERARRRTLELPVTVGIPVDAVAFLPTGNEHVADLELLMALRDDDGRETGEIEAIPFRVRLPSPPRAGGFVRYETTLRLRDQPHRIALAVRDRVGGAVVTGLAQFEP